MQLEKLTMKRIRDDRENGQGIHDENDSEVYDTMKKRIQSRT